MKLHFRKYGSGEAVFILHGVFGSGDNWLTVGKELSKKYTVYLIDIRNHGSSPHDPEMNYQVMAGDIAELMRQESLDQIRLIGHSMGGKVAMQFACMNPESVRCLTVVDISPKYYPPHHQDIFDGFFSITPSDIKSRKEADEKMSQKIQNPGVRQFILKNLDRTGDGFSWKLNLEAIWKNADRIGEALDPDMRFVGPTLFIAGEKSDYITEKDRPLITKHFPEASLTVIKGAGHWVHAEKPVEITEALINFLS